jgi:Ycf66 protein N-terminus
MVNVGLGFMSVLGIALAASGLALYFLRSFRPKLARDQDIVFAAIALLCGGILFFQGWRQDPILQFGQFLLTGSAVFFAVESVRLRGVATEQARRAAPIVDEERPVSSVYRAELDDFDAFDDRSKTRRIRGSGNARPSRDEYDDAPRRRSANGRASLDDYSGSYSGNSPRRRPSEDDVRSPSNYYLEDEGSRDSRYRTSSGSSSGSSRPTSSSPSSKSRRPRHPADDMARSQSRDYSGVEIPPSEYVDYRPIDNPDEKDNWGDE